MPQITTPHHSPMWAARQRRGWTLRKLSDRCKAAGRHVDHGHLGRIERGEVVPGPALRELLARLLELDAVDDFEVKAG